MKALLAPGLKAWRRVAGENTRLETALRRQYRAIRNRIDRQIVADDHVVFWSRADQDRRIGIYLKGICHLQAVFACQPVIQGSLNGTFCIYKDGEIAASRSDFILQTMGDLPRERLAGVLAKLNIPPQYFRPKMFERTFSVPGLAGSIEFPKSVVFFSVGADLARNMYRHRESGILVDPGGWWLNQPMEQVLGDLSTVTWFRENFENIGKMDVAASARNYEKIIALLRKETGAQVVVFNIPTVEPGKLVHNFQFVRDPLVKRTREFNVVIAELSRKLDFPIVDLDRILKKAGIAEQKDFAHFSPELAPAIAQEAFGVMKDLNVF